MAFLHFNDIGIDPLAGEDAGDPDVFMDPLEDDSGKGGDSTFETLE